MHAVKDLWQSHAVNTQKERTQIQEICQHQQPIYDAASCSMPRASSMRPIGVLLIPMYSTLPAILFLTLRRRSDACSITTATQKCKTESWSCSKTGNNSECSADNLHLTVYIFQCKVKTSKWYDTQLYAADKFSGFATKQKCFSTPYSDKWKLKTKAWLQEKEKYNNNKKALLSQRRPRDAPYMSLPWKVSRALANAPGYFSRNL